ncbi:hypothetical protein Y88_0288 [Novosphingobium nitrogenifigens DSM 19370]|uniref:allene-oxide cyclase n=1 Tax=Novosphingobium nitrogenifigens DSM 19370 TaxID=983920 RepID=F1ZAY6_9SPHN|nr:allene oxide cyclase family protein [Novosphingobium nitrogenifigens]EGD58236.1 hypothetical protein Y88_0288 [Novosphingobium nitrogenifigens DSM 19370]
MLRALILSPALALAVAAPAHAASPVEMKIDLVERAETDVVSLHGGSAADNVGDLATFTNPIYDAANQVKLGHDQGYCVRLVVGKTMECHWTLFLEKGQISVDGPVYDGADSTLAVTGGTGLYAAVHGEVKIHPRDAKASGYDFHYRVW